MPLWRAFLVSAVLALPIAAQAPTGVSAFLESLLRTNPTTSPIGKSAGTMTIWRVSDPTSASFGLTVCWLELDPSVADLRLDVGGKKSDADLAKSSPRPLVIVSGGTAKIPRATVPQDLMGAGLVIAGDVSQTRLTDAKEWSMGGVFLRCGSELSVWPFADYQKATALKSAATRSVVTPCERTNSRTEIALQSELLLVRNGKAASTSGSHGRANRVAIGVGQKRGRSTIVVGGAFNDSNGALELADFAGFLALAAGRQGVNGLTAVNLDGGCGAYLWLLQAKQQRWGCQGPIVSPNRFLVYNR